MGMMRRRRGLLVLLALLALATFPLSGCGGGGDEMQPAATETAAETDTEAAHEGDPAAGKQVFAEAGCGNCHTLEAAGATGTKAPNLDQRGPELTHERVVDQVTNGGQRMPPFKGKLSEQQITDVAAFVIESTQG
jgi:mono/diheme cytochrome c family protein